MRSLIGHSDGALDGPFMKWDYESRLVTQGQYKAGKKTGRWVEGSGGGGSEGTWVEDQRDGPWIFRGPGGGIAAQGRYERGHRVGEWKRFRETGKLLAAGPYEWCSSPPETSEAKVANGGVVQEDGSEGCKKGTWSYWTDYGELHGRFDHDETDLKNRPHPSHLPLAATVLPE
jgi:hypothetical protein